MKVELINKDEIRNIYYNWGEIACKCYDTPIERAVGVGKHCLKSGHYSGSRTTYFKFNIEDISRACSLQLNRHNVGVILNQQSQRYVEMSNIGNYVPPKIKSNKQALDIYNKHINKTKQAYIEIQKILLDCGFTKEEANEEARNVLCESTHTTGVWCFTLEALIHFMHKRLCTRAQAEIRQLANAMRKEVLKELPELKDYFVPHCKYLLWCPEKKSCGLMMTKEKLIESINGDKHE